MSFLAAAGIMAGSSLLGGILGRSDAKAAQRQQEGYINQAIGRNDALVGQFDERLAEALGFGQQRVDILAGLPQEVAAAFDAGLVAELTRMTEQRQQEQARQNMRVNQAGLGGTTVAAQLRRALDRQVGRGFAETSARFAQGRAGAVSQATGMYAGALGDQAGLTLQGAAQRAALQQFVPQLLGNVQVVPPNTGQQVGALGAGLAGLFQNQALIDALGTDPYSAALGQMAGGGSGGGATIPPWLRNQVSGF